MTNILEWPSKVLRWRENSFVPVSMSRSGGRALNSFERTVRTDRGYWRASIGSIIVSNSTQWRVWQALDVELGGRPGLLAMPACNLVNSLPEGASVSKVLSHADGTYFSDGSGYRGSGTAIEMAETASIGETVIKLRAVHAGDDLTGMRFSYNHALYQTGGLLSVAGNVWELSVFPSVRASIPAGALLECDRPSCLMHLARDDEMQISRPIEGAAMPSINLVEALDYWNDLAKDAS